MGAVSTEHRTAHIYLQQEISGEFTKVLAGSTHESVESFLEHLFDLYTKASKTTQAVVVREDVAQKFTALQCETRFQTSDDLMKHLLNLHVEHLKTSSNDIVKQQQQQQLQPKQERVNPRKSRKSQPKRNIKHSSFVDSDESCDLITAEETENPWGDDSVSDSRESMQNGSDRSIDLSRVKQETGEKEKLRTTEHSDKVMLIKRIFHKKDGSGRLRHQLVKRGRSNTVTHVSESEVKVQSQMEYKQKGRLANRKVKSGRKLGQRLGKLTEVSSDNTVEIDGDDADLDEETRLACVNIENVEGDWNDIEGQTMAFDPIHDKRVEETSTKATKKVIYSYNCFKCRRKFRNRAPLNLHLALEHGDDSAAGLLCNLCGKQADYDHELDLHKKFSCKKIKRKFDCEICRLRFSEESEKAVHPCSRDPDKPYYCSIEGCGTYCKYLRDLTVHVTRHLGLKPFLCNICGKAFSAKKDMDRHSDTHRESKDYTCQQCGASYQTYNSLKRHLFSHRFKDRYKCEECSYTTAQKYSFDQHMIRHSTYTNQCQICKKKLRTKKSLEKHVQNRHTFNRIFTCRYCDFSTDVGLSYSSHMRHHRNLKKTDNSTDISNKESSQHDADLDISNKDSKNQEPNFELAETIITVSPSVTDSSENVVSSPLSLVATRLPSNVSSDITLTSACSSTTAPLLAEAAILNNMEVGICGKNVDVIMANIVASSDTSDISVLAPESSHTNILMYPIDTTSTSLSLPSFVSDSIIPVSQQETWDNTSENN
ncbi:Broad-Complex [Mactra antiquata]